jgi:hypothetical protein
LSNKNENAKVLKNPKFWELNKALMVPSRDSLKRCVALLRFEEKKLLKPKKREFPPTLFLHKHYRDPGKAIPYLQLYPI